METIRIRIRSKLNNSLFLATLYPTHGPIAPRAKEQDVHLILFFHFSAILR